MAGIGTCPSMGVAVDDSGVARRRLVWHALLGAERLPFGVLAEPDAGAMLSQVHEPRFAAPRNQDRVARRWSRRSAPVRRWQAVVR